MYHTSHPGSSPVPRTNEDGMWSVCRRNTELTEGPLPKLMGNQFPQQLPAQETGPLSPNLGT